MRWRTYLAKMILGYEPAPKPKPQRYWHPTDPVELLQHDAGILLVRVYEFRGYEYVITVSDSTTIAPDKTQSGSGVAEMPPELVAMPWEPLDLTLDSVVAGGNWTWSDDPTP